MGLELNAEKIYIGRIKVSNKIGMGHHQSLLRLSAGLRIKLSHWLGAGHRVKASRWLGDKLRIKDFRRLGDGFRIRN